MFSNESLSNVFFRRSLYFFFFFFFDCRSSKMWQEMRKHEKKLRGMIVDYKKRSERRKEYYERIVRLTGRCSLWDLRSILSRNVIRRNSYKSGVDPRRFISIQPLPLLLKRPCQSLDVFDGQVERIFSFRTPWRDDEETLIDRFDVRSHLDIIDEYALRQQQTHQVSESVLFRLICSSYSRTPIDKHF